MKLTIYSLLALVVMLALPATASAYDHGHGWHHHHGYHYGWYHHHGYWHHYNGWYGPRYGYLGYPGNTVCDYYGDRCWSTGPVVPPWGYGGYYPMTYPGT